MRRDSWREKTVPSRRVERSHRGAGDHVRSDLATIPARVWVLGFFVFLLAPFFGLLWAVGSMGLSSLLHRKRRELPYGPHLAVATLVVLLGRPAMNWIQSIYLPWLPQP